MGNQDERSPAWPRPAVGWYVVLVLAVACVLAFIDRTILSLLVGPIRHDLGLNDTQLSLLQGFAFAIFYTTLGIPIARLADQSNRRNVIAAGIAFWSVATAACGLARSYLHLFMARIGVGVGEASLSPASFSMISDLFPPEKLGRALATYTLGAFAGTGLAYLIGGAIVQQVLGMPPVTLPLLGTVRSWQLVFLVVGLLGLPVAIWVSTLAEPLRRNTGSAAAQGAIEHGFASLLGHMRRHRRTYASHLLGFSFLALVFNAALNWYPAFLMRVFQLTAARAGFLIGLVVLILGVGGVLLGGWLTDWWRQQGRSDASMRVGVLAAACATPFGMLSGIAPSLAGSLASFALLVLFATLPYGAAAAAIQLVTPPTLRATASSVYLCVLSLIGLGAGPTAVALLTDYVFADDLAVGRSLAVVIALAGTLAAALLYWGLSSFRVSAAEQTSQSAPVGAAG